ncbi:MAG: response regulator [Candidatus Zixiibacteriota bacterium]|nr:MAG: response regulator [candidate division Zixibacteria bacterium]
MASTRILIVDDEEEFANTLAERMRNRNLEVDTVSNGEEALESIVGVSYDAVVLDLAMPGMDGIETLKQMLSIKPDLQVILLTGRGSVEKGVEAIKSGAFEFLEKPVKFENLLDKINMAKSKKDALSEEHTSDMIDEILRRKGW